MNDIKGFEGLYAVTKNGQVWSYPKYHRRSGKFLAFGKDKNGYHLVGLHKNGKQTMGKVHRLVAQTFIPNPENLAQVNHKNGIKTDNRVKNLEWCDGFYNQKHGRRLGLIPHAPRAKLTPIQIRKIRSLKGIKTQTEIAKQFEVTQGLIGFIHRGLIWKELLSDA